MIETTARWRSMVSGLRTDSFSCREPLLPAIEIQPLTLSIRHFSTHGRGRGSVPRAVPFFALSALALGPWVLYYWVAVHRLCSSSSSPIPCGPIGPACSHLRAPGRCGCSPYPSLVAVVVIAATLWRRRQLGWRLLVPVGVLQTPAGAACCACCGGRCSMSSACGIARTCSRSPSTRRPAWLTARAERSRLQEVAAALQNGTLAQARRHVRSAAVQLRADHDAARFARRDAARRARRRASAMRSSRCCRVPAACRSPASC